MSLDQVWLHSEFLASMGYKVRYLKKIEGTIVKIVLHVEMKGC